MKMKKDKDINSKVAKKLSMPWQKKPERQTAVHKPQQRKIKTKQHEPNQT